MWDLLVASWTREHAFLKALVGCIQCTAPVAVLPLLLCYTRAGTFRTCILKISAPSSVTDCC